MYIAIKSEADSRPLLYQLVKSLWNYGTIAVISSNKQLKRLIDDDEDSNGFRNVTIIVDEDGATDDIYNQYGIAPGDYDFILLDNMGVVDYDACFVMLGSKHSPGFDDDVKYMVEGETGPKVWLIQFGRPGQKKREPRPESHDRNRRRSGNEIPDDYDPAKKFHDKVDSDKQRQARAHIFNVPYPTMDEIETFEGERRMFEVNSSLVKPIYEAIKGTIGVQENQFRKEVRKKDESSGNIRRRNTVGEE